MLPTGSVVVLNGSEDKVLISGKKRIGTLNNKVWDYVGELLNGEGEYSFVFDREDIAEVIFTGYSEEIDKTEAVSAESIKDEPQPVEQNEVAPQPTVSEEIKSEPDTRFKSIEEIMREEGMEMSFASATVDDESEPADVAEEEVESISEAESEPEEIAVEAEEAETPEPIAEVEEEIPEPIAEAAEEILKSIVEVAEETPEPEVVKPIEVTLTYKEGDVDRVVRMASQTLSVGRGVDSDVKLLDTFVSKNHACISIKDGGVYLKDLDSRNGTFVNGTRINGEVSLERSCEVKFASTTVKITILQ
jgi:hypothetical protein